MTNEEAFGDILHAIKWAEALDDNWCNLIRVDSLRIALEALEKQIPKKVRAHQDCPVCGANVIGSGFYCWNCGQHITWEEGT